MRALQTILTCEPLMRALQSPDLTKPIKELNEAWILLQVLEASLPWWSGTLCPFAPNMTSSNITVVNIPLTPSLFLSFTSPNFHFSCCSSQYEN